MIIKKLKIVIPIWNCKKCFIERKKYIINWCKNNHKFIKNELFIEFVFCQDNSDAVNSKFVFKFLEIIKKNLDIKIIVGIK